MTRRVRGIDDIVLPDHVTIDPAPMRHLDALARQLADLDPDLALWPTTIVQRWPFSGPPTTDTWPLGWIGLDNQATLWICTQGGSPGTWQGIAADTGALVALPPPLTSGTAVQTFRDGRGQLWIAKAGVNGGAWVNPLDVLHVQATVSAAWNIPAATFVAFPLDTARTPPGDPYGLLVVAPGGYLLTPIAGNWKLSFGFGVGANIAAPGYLQGAISLTPGGAARFGQFAPSEDPGPFPNTQDTNTVYIPAATQVYGIAAISGVTGTFPGAVGGQTYLEMDYLGGG